MADDLAKALTFLRSGMDRVVRREVRLFAAGVQRAAPRGSGRLASSVVVTPAGVEVGAPYASFVDEDTGFATGDVDALEAAIVEAIERGLS